MTVDDDRNNDKNNDRNYDRIVSSDVPFGAVSYNSQILFTTAVKDVESCLLLLYKKDVEEAVASIQMERIAGNVFQILVDNKNINADYYMYKTGETEFADPYAKLLAGRERFGCVPSDDKKVLVKGYIENQSFDWEGDKSIYYRWSDTILYKLHVRGYTKTADIPLKHRGTYLGIADMSGYFNELGVNTLLLMPCVEFDEIMEMDSESFGKPEGFGKSEGFGKPERFEKPESSIKAKNFADPKDFIEQVNIEDEKNCKINYWGYAKHYNYFAPKASYAVKPDKASIEFKHMVKTLHIHNISVIMEMEFDKGISIKHIIDCLKYWAFEYHIDGFKINITNAAILEEPWIADKKLILPDFSDELIRYDAGKEQKRLAIYNDGFMYAARMFLKGDDYKTEAFTDKTSKGESGIGIINYITDHNGFTLMDLYSYEHKHNEDNGEENRDGRVFNFSWNCGVEGISRKKDVTNLRLKMRKNAIASILLSQGTPMIYAGDEFGNSQKGNNNAYCQDNPIGWIDWKAKKNNEELLSFTKQLILLRMRYTMLHYPVMLRKMDYISCGYPDITFHGRKAWYPDYAGLSKALGVLLCGRYAKLVTKNEEEDIYIVYNMHWEPHIFDLPSMNTELEWKMVLTTEGNDQRITSACKSHNTRIKTDKKMIKQYMIAPRSIAVFISKLNDNFG